MAVTTVTENRRDIERHEKWLNNLDERMRAVELNSVKNQLKIAAFAALGAAIMSAVLAPLAVLFIGKFLK